MKSQEAVTQQLLASVILFYSLIYIVNVLHSHVKDDE